jgi:hypothetical protein
MSFTYFWAVKNCFFESAASAVVFLVDLTCCTTFILLIELEKISKSLLERGQTKYFFKKES